MFEAVRNAGDVIVIKGCDRHFKEDWSKEDWISFFEEDFTCSQSEKTGPFGG